MSAHKQAAEAAIGYVRVSTDEQSHEGVSLDAQEARLRAYCEAHGLTLIELVREEGVSAKIPLRDRPQGARVVEALARGRARHVVALKLDRLFRNTADALVQTERWARMKCALHVVDMAGNAVDTASAVGKMFFTMAAAFAEMERNLTSERTKVAMRHLRDTRQVYTYITPYGFDQVGKSLIDSPSEMATVREIQALRAGGASLRKIAAHLTARGIPTKRGGAWHAVTIQSILRVHASSK